MSMFRALGLTDTEEKVHQALLDSPSASLTTLALSTGVPEPEVLQALISLEEHGLVSRSTDDPPTFLPAPPDVAVEALILRQQRALELARLHANRLATTYRDNLNAGRSHNIVEVVQGRQAIAQRFAQLQRGAREEMQVLDKPPYVVPHDQNRSAVTALIEAGVRYRAIFERATLTSPGGLDQAVLAAGQEARVTREVPLKLAIADRHVALVPISLGGPRRETAALVHSSPLLTALVALFELLWSHAAPLQTTRRHRASRADDDQLSEEDRQMLRLMLAGLQDQAIARHLGITTRTVTRRVNRLMLLTHAETRFQLAWHAVRRGWL